MDKENKILGIDKEKIKTFIKGVGIIGIALLGLNLLFSALP